MDTPCLVLEGLTKEFGGLIAVDHVNLEIKAGERHGIIGPNGAGKTTLFNLICGDLSPTEGKIVHFGQDVTRLRTHKRIALGMSRTFQINNLFPKLTVLQNVLLAAQGLQGTKYVMYRPISSYESLYDKAKDILEEFQMWDKRDVLVENLSYGDQRQIEVCLALIENPRLLLLDEPTAGLSRAETLTFTSILKKLDPDITILLIEHDMDVAFDLAENITVLQLGKRVASGNNEEIKANKTVQEIYLGTDQ
ncbi:MAG: ABC transporter ATP-binding protein [Desulfobacteraceae bacterium]|nr:ABC transporter ATP-binding protein [Desulfobacteraceae bacterium]